MATGGQNLADFSMNDLFKMEVETQAAVLNDGLLALERDPNQPEKFEALMRAAHSIKGAARIVNLDAAVKLAHRIEDCFVAAQEGRLRFAAEDMDILLASVDLLVQMSQVPPDKFETWMAEKQSKYDELGGKIDGIGKAEKSKAEITTKAQRHEEESEENAETPKRRNAAITALPKSPDPPVIRSPDLQIGNQPSAIGHQESPDHPIPKSPDSKPLPAHAAPESADRVVRVATERLNRLMGLAGESLVEARRLGPLNISLLKLKSQYQALAALLDQLEQTLPAAAVVGDTQRVLAELRASAAACRQGLNERIGEVENFSRRADDLSSRLYRETTASQMRPFADGVQSFPRLVRDLARSLGKQVRLQIVGEKTAVDRDILEKLEAPLTHIIRNALDHGIELPTVRQAAGKPAEGTIRLEARHSAGTLVITVSDDGGGVNLDKLRAKILQRGLVGADVVGRLSDAELIDFLFLPGFSTAEKVTEVSGRGVGMDVAASMAHSVGGNVRATSTLGQGMAIALHLPITLSVTAAALARIAGEPYAFPLTRVDRILTLAPEEVRQLEGKPCFELEGETVGLVSAAQVLELEDQPRPAGKLCIVVVSDRTQRYGLAVDEFLGEGDLVVRPLDPRLGKLQDISAAAIMEDGTPLLIVDVEDLARSIANLLSGGRLGRLSRAQESAKAAAKRILVVDDSITVREMERRLLENHGYQVDVAVDGMDGWNAVRGGPYDLVVSDIDMPRLNGFELVRMIKVDNRLSHIPVIIVSYKDREEDRRRGLEAGANCYLTKSSFQDETLLSRIVDLIGEA